MFSLFCCLYFRLSSSNILPLLHNTHLRNNWLSDVSLLTVHLAPTVPDCKLLNVHSEGRSFVLSCIYYILTVKFSLFTLDDSKEAWPVNNTLPLLLSLRKACPQLDRYSIAPCFLINSLSSQSWLPRLTFFECKI